MERNQNAKCSNCWLCRSVCPAYKAMQDEIVSPRHKNNMIDKFSEEKFDKSFFYKYCNWCEACLAVCPLKVWFDVIKAREEVVNSWFELKENLEMLENIKKYKNPFWKIDNSKWWAPDKLYCC